MEASAAVSGGGDEEVIASFIAYFIPAYKIFEAYGVGTFIGG